MASSEKLQYVKWITKIFHKIGKSLRNFCVDACVMEIEKEDDWAAENVLAYERVLRL